MVVPPGILSMNVYMCVCVCVCVYTECEREGFGEMLRQLELSVGIQKNLEGL
jgi:hypothetical protein